jgi:Cu-Zn family superoxide dismutase
MRIPLIVSSLVFAGVSLTSSLAFSAEKTVTIHAISEAGIGKSIGTITFSDSNEGLVIKPNLSELSAGTHGFHIHEKPSCDAAEKDGKVVAGQAAGGHYDPNKSTKHEGPMGAGHKGDLPALEVTADNHAEKPLLAPNLKLADISGHAVIIHEGGDNYSDTPKPLGGGGGRVACGIME